MRTSSGETVFHKVCSSAPQALTMLQGRGQPASWRREGPGCSVHPASGAGEDAGRESVQPAFTPCSSDTAGPGSHPTWAKVGNHCGRHCARAEMNGAFNISLNLKRKCSFNLRSNPHSERRPSCALKCWGERWKGLETQKTKLRNFTPCHSFTE